MKSKGRWLLVVLTSVFLMGLSRIGGGPKIPTELIGTWDYTSMTTVKDGKPFGTVHLDPGYWTVTFNSDATWTMKTPTKMNPCGLNGTYEVRGRELDMKLVGGKPHGKFKFIIDQDRKELILSNKETTWSATRE
jgi:hypothetical protein